MCWSIPGKVYALCVRTCRDRAKLCVQFGRFDSAVNRRLHHLDIIYFSAAQQLVNWMGSPAVAQLPVLIQYRHLLLFAVYKFAHNSYRAGERFVFFATLMFVLCSLLSHFRIVPIWCAVRCVVIRGYQHAVADGCHKLKSMGRSACGARAHSLVWLIHVHFTCSTWCTQMVMTHEFEHLFRQSDTFLCAWSDTASICIWG